MATDLEGDRRRTFVERTERAERAGNPLVGDVSAAARRRLMREVLVRAVSYDDADDEDGERFDAAIYHQLYVVLGMRVNGRVLEDESCNWPTLHFLSVLELCAWELHDRRPFLDDISVLQSILADDFSAYRFQNVGTAKQPRYEIVLLDNPHLHDAIVDRAFELTRLAGFASAQGDYAEAWKHYTKGELEPAVVCAHRGVESACKVVVKKVDPTSTPENLKLHELVAALRTHRVLPDPLHHSAGQVAEIFRNAGSFRNSPGVAHGSLDPIDLEQCVALLSLRMSGTLIAFLAERWQQLHSGTP